MLQWAVHISAASILLGRPSSSLTLGALLIDFRDHLPHVDGLGEQTWALLIYGGLNLDYAEAEACESTFVLYANTNKRFSSNAIRHHKFAVAQTVAAGALSHSSAALLSPCKDAVLATLQTTYRDCKLFTLTWNDTKPLGTLLQTLRMNGSIKCAIDHTIGMSLRPKFLGKTFNGANCRFT